MEKKLFKYLSINNAFLELGCGFYTMDLFELIFDFFYYFLVEKE